MSKNNFQAFSKETFDLEWAKIKEKNRQEDEKARLLMESIKLSQQKSMATKKLIQQTLKGAKSTMTDIKNTTQKIDTFKKQYQNAMDNLAIRCMQGFEGTDNPLKKQTYKDYTNSAMPVVVGMKEAVQQMLKYDEILFITGAGISAASGIATFRGQGGLYTSLIKVGKQQLPAEQVLTRRFYEQNPKVVWDWLVDFKKINDKAKPNQAHRLLDLICKELIKRKKQVTIVTQNLDNLHGDPTEYKVFHIHGDIRYIRCENMHLSPFSSQQLKCHQCESKMRPHILFFDQQYTGLYGNDIKNHKYDMIVTIGTMLETGLARKFVKQADLTIEINLSPVIEVGRVYQFKGKANQILKEMADELI